MKTIRKKISDFLYRYFICIIGLTIMAISYNLFYVPNNYVTGGVTGLSIIFGEITPISPNVFILIGNIFLIVLSIAILGPKKSIYNIVGAITFTVAVYLTGNISEIIKLNFDSSVFYVLCAGVTMGVGAGIVYKVNFTSGGTDVLVSIFNEKFKKPVGQTGLYINGIIIIFGTYVFGFEMLISAIIIKYIESLLVDKILLGISDSKMLLINTTKEEEVKKYLLKSVESGITLLNGKGGYTNKNHDIIMCIVRTDNYYKVKEEIKEIDPYAFIIVSDCYEVFGGTKKKKKLPIKIKKR